MRLIRAAVMIYVTHGIFFTGILRELEPHMEFISVHTVNVFAFEYDEVVHILLNFSGQIQ